jgi:pyrroline-5-carboxylate reductase
MFSACGVQEEVRAESQIDYFSALTGTGPAYPAVFAEAMMLDAVGRGVDRHVARRAVMTLMVGAARLSERQQRCPSEVVQEFVDYAGMTAAGIEEMRRAGIADVVRAGVEAALKRGRTLQNSS